MQLPALPTGAPLPPGLIPSLMQSPANAGPAVGQSANQGNEAMAIIDIQNAVKMLEKALPMIPIGSPMHGDLLNVMKTLSKHVSQESGSNEALGLQSILQMAKARSQASPMSALAKLFPAPGAAPAMAQPGGGTPMPIPQAA